MYITQHNLERITRKIEFDIELEQKAQKFYHEISFLTKYESRNLYFFKMILEDPETYSSLVRVKFVQKQQQQVSYINQSNTTKKPAFHLFDTCAKLHADFIGLNFPNATPEEMGQYKEWMRRNPHLFKSGNEHQLEAMFQLKFKKSLVRTVRENSGYHEFKADSLEDLKTKIDETIQKGKQFGNSPMEKKIAHVFSKMHYITKKEDFTSTHYNTDLVKNVMKRFNAEIRYPLMKLMKEYFILKYNSNLEMNKGILDQLEFRQCSSCARKQSDLEFINKERFNRN